MVSKYLSLQFLNHKQKILYSRLAFHHVCGLMNGYSGDEITKFGALSMYVCMARPPASCGQRPWASLTLLSTLTDNL